MHNYIDGRYHQFKSKLYHQSPIYDLFLSLSLSLYIYIYIYIYIYRERERERERERGMGRVLFSSLSLVSESFSSTAGLLMTEKIYIGQSSFSLWLQVRQTGETPFSMALTWALLFKSNDVALKAMSPLCCSLMIFDSARNKSLF